MTRDTKNAQAEYIAATFASSLPAGMEEVHAKGESLRPFMQISAAEGKLLAFLVALKKPRLIVEVGTFVGYSTLWMASTLPPGGKIITLEKNAHHAALARSHCTTYAHAAVEVIEGDALTSIAALNMLSAGIDMVFIDAEKRRYPDYLEALFPLLAPHALVVADNTLLFGTVYNDAPDSDSASSEAWNAMRRFNAMLADDTIYTGILLPTSEGMTVAVKKE